MEQMTKCYFVSDLHLFANRSDAHRYLEAITRAALHAEAFVLGGDIFDFRWSSIPILRAVERAAEWLRELASACPRCEFHLVLGNHDYHQALIDRLAVLEREVSNLSWHRYYVRLGSSVFLHGDVADKTMDARMLAEARDQWLDRRRRGPFMSALYDVVVMTQLHRPVPHLVYAKRIVVRRILKYLESIGQGPHDGVRNVYFGHTHRRLSNYRYRGLAFHNGGAPIKGMKFHIIEARR
jgi:UDP-2,3-diacylglucosamine pyrophosphatase LpxH